jgi:CheY-like chemotaxis protein
MSRCRSRYPSGPRSRARALVGVARDSLATPSLGDSSAERPPDEPVPTAAGSSRPAHPEPAPRPAARQVATGLILVVDDDPLLLEVIATILQQEGYAIATAPNGAEALDVVAQQPPALVLLDMRMPVVDGWGFARALQERGVAVPLIVMTAAQDAHRWAEEVEAAACLAKPFELPELLEAIERMLTG